MNTSPRLFNILVADDSPLYRKLLERSLSQEDYAIQFAKDGREAMDLFTRHRPAVVITDWTMPDISGLELCRRIRRDSLDSYVHVILLTSNADKENVIEGLAAGADDYLTKPFHPGELQARVRVGRRIVELHRQVQEKNRLLQELALTDSLTGLPNRRAIEEWATQQLASAARHDFSFWVAIADLDHFKTINDTYGHEAGDVVLKSFSEILRSNTRRSNSCGRLGGEEFLVLLTHAEKHNVARAIDRIRRKFETQEFVFKNQKCRATASFGIAGFRGAAAPDLRQLVARADAALYAAKCNGRNRVELSEG